jgi:hypothetical protein
MRWLPEWKHYYCRLAQKGIGNPANLPETTGPQLRLDHTDDSQPAGTDTDRTDRNHESGDLTTRREENDAVVMTRLETDETDTIRLEKGEVDRPLPEIGGTDTTVHEIAGTAIVPETVVDQPTGEPRKTTKDPDP